MRQYMVVGVIFTTLFMSGCSGSQDPEPQSNETQEATTMPSDDTTDVTPLENPVPGFNGSCEGFDIFAQNQFSAEDGGYGAKVRSSIDGQVLAEGILGNTPLRAVGWYDTGQILPAYTDNPEGIQGQVWYYVPDLNNAQGGWVADVGIRAVKTRHAPGNADSSYIPDTQAPPKPPECELTR